MKAGKLMVGLVLFAAGTLTLLDSLDIAEVRHLGRYWPVIPLAIGIAGELDALRRRKADGSFVLIAIGVWFLAARQHWLGLSGRDAMPLGIMVVGAFIALHAIIDRPRSIEATEEEKHHEQLS